MFGGMVEVAAPRACLGVAARPCRDVHRVDRRVLCAGVSGSQQSPERFYIDPALGERGVEAAPAAAVDAFEAQVGWRMNITCRQDRIGKLEQRVGSAPHASVEGFAELA